VPVVDATIPALPRADDEARSVIRARLADSLPAPALYDLLTVVSELVANGVHHGDPGSIRLLVTVEDDGATWGLVENPGRGRPAPREIDADTGSRLGLHIVDAVAERWDADTRNGTTRVRFRLDPR
jgi:anti-sigma regulatory factor (Ser/Thr protein kinase)